MNTVLAKPEALIFCLLGLYPLCAAIFDWDWFMNHRKARLFVKIFGRQGSRIFYAILGCALIAIGWLGATGVIPFETK